MIDSRPQIPSSVRGFTLLELLVVMAMMALMTGVVAPRIYKQVEERQRQGERREILAQVIALRMRIQNNGWRYTLGPSENWRHALPDGSPALTPPPGWQIEIPEGIRFSETGLCSGGIIIATHENVGATTLKLTAPACWIDN